MITGEEQERFRECIRRNEESWRREKNGIGMQREKSVHAILKDFYVPDRTCQEVPLLGYIADCFDGGRVTEIQSAGFYRMRDKLSAFLEEYPVTIVHPIPRVKYVTWIDPETGELEKRSKSPVTGTIYDAVRELGGIRPFLGRAGLTVHLALLDLEEYRVRDGWGSGGKRGSHRFDRVPTALADVVVLEGTETYRAFLPEGLPEAFTSADVQRLGASRRKNISYSYLLSILTDLGVVERCGKQGRAYLYRRCQNT